MGGSSYSCEKRPKLVLPGRTGSFSIRTIPSAQESHLFNRPPLAELRAFTAGGDLAGITAVLTPPQRSRSQYH